MALPERQTVGFLIGHMLLGLLAVLGVSRFVFETELTPSTIAEKIIFVELLVTITTATTYSRLPEVRRLPPVHALGLGCLHLCLVAWVLLNPPAEAPARWVTVFGFALLALPGVYLIVKAVGQWRRAVNGATTDPGAT